MNILANILQYISSISVDSRVMLTMMFSDFAYFDKIMENIALTATETVGIN